jgi:hypothetical protein
MGRPPLPIGTHGRIDFHHATSGRIRARVRIRDIDGVLRAVTRWAGTEDEAAALLRIALRNRACRGDHEISGETKLAAAVQTWLVEIDQSDLAVSTRQLYRAAARLYLVPTLGSLRLTELTVAVIERVCAHLIRKMPSARPAAVHCGLSVAAAGRFDLPGHVCDLVGSREPRAMSGRPARADV